MEMSETRTCTNRKLACKTNTEILKYINNRATYEYAYRKETTAAVSWRYIINMEGGTFIYAFLFRVMHFACVSPRFVNLGMAWLSSGVEGTRDMLNWAYYIVVRTSKWVAGEKHGFTSVTACSKGSALRLQHPAYSFLASAICFL